MRPLCRWGAGLSGLGLVATLAAAETPTTPRYGDWLLASVAGRHPELTAVTIDANGVSGPIRFSRGAAPAAGETILALTDAMDRPVGTVSLAFKPVVADAAQQIASEISRRIYTVEGLSDPDPSVAGAIRSRRAQALVDGMIDTHPDLVTLALHVAVAPGGDNRIIASNFGRIGKPADKDDRHVMTDEATLAEVTNGGARLAVELPLHDKTGATIGALSTSFQVEAGQATEAVKSKAVNLRDEMARQIASREVFEE